MASSLLSRFRTLKPLPLLGGTIAFTTLGSATTYWLATREQTFYHLDSTNDPLALSAFVRKTNPHGNESLSDIYEARIPLNRVRPDLIADYHRGGERLVERYCAGVLGGWGFAVQRALSRRHARKKPTAVDPDELYTKAQILDSRFEEGTGISDHFVVLEKTPTSVLFRGGSPSDANGLRKVDSMMQGLVEIDPKENVAVFRLKCMFYDGQAPGNPPPLPASMTPLHLIYARALAASGVANCKR